MPYHKSLATRAKEAAAAKEKAKAERKAARAKAAAKAAPKHPQPSKSKYPWEEVETFFVHGEEATGPNGAPIRTSPTFSDVSRRFGIPISTVSQHANVKDANGKTWYDKRNGYLTQFKATRDTKIVEEIVDAEVAFRKTTLSAAEMIVQHARIQLHNGLRMDAKGTPRSILDPDALTKLAAAARKGQEMGLVAMERDPNGPQGGAALEDWTLMRKVRAGAVGTGGNAHA